VGYGRRGAAVQIEVNGIGITSSLSNLNELCGELTETKDKAEKKQDVSHSLDLV
jgi:hypothetical protein